MDAFSSLVLLGQKGCMVNWCSAQVGKEKVLGISRESLVQKGGRGEGRRKGSIAFSAPIIDSLSTK